MAKGTDYKLAIRIAGSVDPSVQSAAKKASSLLSNIVKADLIASGIKTAANAMKDFAGQSLDTYAAFEQQLANVGAAYNATAEEMAAFEKAARAAGAATSFSAAEAGEGLGFLVQSGMSAKDAITALTPVLQLAETTGQDLGQTSSLVVDSMAAMGVKADNLREYMDALIVAGDATNTTAHELMDAFGKAGGIARTVGMNYNDLSVALGVLANNGVKGAEAGTAMNAILNRMASQKKAQETYKELGVRIYDASGKMRDFDAIMRDTGKALDKLTEKERNAALSHLAGTEHLSKYIYLLDGAKKSTDGQASAFENLYKQLDSSSGALVDKNARVMDTMKGAFARFDSALDEVKIGFFDAFGPQITEKLDWFSSEIMPNIADGMKTAGEAISTAGDHIEDFCNWITDTGARLDELNTFIEDHKTALEVAAIAVTAFTTALVAYRSASIASSIAGGIETAVIWAYCTASNAAAIATKIFSASMAFLTSPVTLVIGAIAALVGIGAYLYNNWDTLAAKGTEIANMLSTKFPWMSDIIDGAVANITNICTGLRDTFGGIVTFVKGVFAGDWGMAWQGIVDTFKGIWDTLTGVLKTPLNAAISLINSAISGINKIKIDIPDWVPGFGGDTLGFNIPKLPMLAEGGIATGPTLAMIGEGRENEAVLPLSKLSAMIGGGTGGGDVIFSPVINVSGTASKHDVESAVGEAFEQFKAFMRQYEHERRRRAFA